MLPLFGQQRLDGQINGIGKLTQPNGDVYEGSFVKGRRAGPGKLTYVSGQIAEGLWENGILMAPAPATVAEDGAHRRQQISQPLVPDKSHYSS